MKMSKTVGGVAAPCTFRIVARGRGDVEEGNANEAEPEREPLLAAAPAANGAMSTDAGAQGQDNGADKREKSECRRLARLQFVAVGKLAA